MIWEQRDATKLHEKPAENVLPKGNLLIGGKRCPAQDGWTARHINPSYAGFMHCRHFLETAVDDYRKLMTIDFESIVVGMQAAIASKFTTRAGVSVDCGLTMT